MAKYKQYPTRSEIQPFGEGGVFVWDGPRNIRVTIAFDGKTYKITHAWIEQDWQKLMTTPDYPFIHSKKDKTIVKRILQSNCEHDYAIYNYHAICFTCELVIYGDYRDQVRIADGYDYVELHDDLILEKYGEEGLALRRGRAGIEENGKND